MQRNAYLIKKLICSIRYPKAFTNSTITEDDGYPLYRRRSFGSGGFKSTVFEIRP